MNITYKNRGMFLEKILNDSNTFYNKEGKALIYKKPTPIKPLDVSYESRKTTYIKKAVFETISTLDYNGVYKGKYIEFDAKETKNKTSFPLSNIKTHQIDHIRNVLKHDGIIFLIIFMNDIFYLFDGKLLIDFISGFERKSIPYEYILDKGYKIEEKYSPRLDYLTIVDTVYFKED